MLRGELDADDACAAARRSRGPAAAVPRRQGDRVVERPDARRVRAGRPRRHRRCVSRSSCSARCRRPTGGSTAPGATALRRNGLPGGLRRRRLRPDGAPHGDRRAAVPARGIPPHAGSRSRYSPTTSSAASSRRRWTASASSRGRRRSTIIRHRAATRCLRTSSCVSRGSGGTTSSSAAGVSVLRLVRAGVTRSPTSFGWMLVALDQHLAPHRELAIVGDAHAPVARRCARRAAPTDVIAFGPADGRAAARRSHQG